MDFNPETMRARFHALGRQREEKLAASIPLREARDAFSQQTAAQLAAMNEEIKAAEVGLYEIDVERAALARALNGKTGSPE